MNAFNDKLQELMPNSSGKSLSNLSETRFVERHVKVVQFLEMYPSVLATLWNIEEWNDTTAASKATQYLSALHDHSFVIALCVCARFSSPLLPISKSLQQVNVDFNECAAQVKYVTSLLQGCRDKGEGEFNKIQAKEPITIPRKYKNQINRANFPTSDPETYFRQSIFIPYVD